MRKGKKYLRKTRTVSTPVPATSTQNVVVLAWLSIPKTVSGLGSTAAAVL